tara:strand:- start:1194 stop:1517 length:324 start_codon:yes stop_codon:yes gene_type:complete
MVSKYTHDYVNGVKVELTAEQIKAYEDRDKAWEADKPNRDLQRIKALRLEKLQETDWWVLRGNMTDAQIQYRQKLRDIPADYNSSKYDELLARDSDNKLTHSVWIKP